MKTAVKKIDKTKRELSIEITGDVVKNKFEDVFAKIAKEAKIPGFRPGNAPRDILEKKFSSHAHQQVLDELVPDIYDQAIKQEGLNAVELPNITEVKLDRNSLSFKAEVEVMPEIEVKNYKGIKVSYQPLSVTTDEVKRHLDTLKESRQVQSTDDNFAKSLSYPSLSELEKAIERQVLLQKDNAQRQKIEGEIIDGITKDADFQLPQALVRRQLDDLVRQAKIDLALKGVPAEKIKEEEKKLTEGLENEAKRQVKIYLVLAEIARKENIPQNDQMAHRVMEFLFREADWGNSGK